MIQSSYMFWPLLATVRKMFDTGKIKVATVICIVPNTVLRMTDKGINI